MVRKKMVVDDVQVVFRSFENISEFVKYIDGHETKSLYVNDTSSNKIGNRRTEFTGTKTYEEARQLLLDGWKYGTDKIIGKMKNQCIETKRKTIYDVCGHYACVPRYLQGIPMNMIRTSYTQERKKVVKINKIISYHCKVEPERMIEEGAKVLECIKRMEGDGTRVELYALISLYDKELKNKNVVRVCVKKSGQRLNIKQVAFPLVHPSMFRRIFFSFIERAEEFNIKGYYNGYGINKCDMKVESVVIPGEYIIPAMIEEEEIVDIEKYKVGK